MTVCVGLLHKDFCILASDSRVSYESGTFYDKATKIIDVGGKGALAISGTLGAGQKLARLLGTHPNPLDVPINEIPDEPPNCIYMNPDRKMFVIDSGFGVTELKDGEYFCVGSGCDIAETSIMKQLGKRKIAALDYKAATKIIEEAIQDACRLNLYCAPPIVVKVFKRG